MLDWWLLSACLWRKSSHHLRGRHVVLVYNIYICIYVSMYVCIYVSMYVCRYVRMHARMYECMYMRNCIYSILVEMAVMNKKRRFIYLLCVGCIRSVDSTGGTRNFSSTCTIHCWNDGTTKGHFQWSLRECLCRVLGSGIRMGLCWARKWVEPPLSIHFSEKSW